jgi:uncharacterized protein (DUF433 family)
MDKRKEMLDKFKEKSFELGRRINRDEILKIYDKDMIRQYFISINKALYATTYEFDENELIYLLKEKNKKIGFLPEPNDFKYPWAIVFINKFGSWDNALINAGLQLNSPDIIIYKTDEDKSSLELIHKLKEKELELNKITLNNTKIKEIDNLTGKSKGQPIIKEKKLTKKELKQIEKKEKLKTEKEFLLNNIRQKYNELKHIPTIKDMGNNALIQKIVKRFGSWKNALYLLGYINQDYVLDIFNMRQQGIQFSAIASKYNISRQRAQQIYARYILDNNLTYYKIIKEKVKKEKIKQLPKNIRINEFGRTEKYCNKCKQWKIIDEEFNKNGVNKNNEILYYSSCKKCYNEYQNKYLENKKLKNKKLENKIQKKYTDEFLLNVIKEKYNELKLIPSISSINNNVLVKKIITRFGSWNKAIKITGIEGEKYNQNFQKHNIRNKNIYEMVQQSVSDKEIAKLYELPPKRIYQIYKNYALKNNLLWNKRIQNNNLKNIEEYNIRNKNIFDMVQQDIPAIEIAQKYKLSKNNVYHIYMSYIFKNNISLYKKINLKECKERKRRKLTKNNRINENNEIERLCSKCKQWKTLDKFYLNHYNKNNEKIYCSKCKSCDCTKKK